MYDTWVSVVEVLVESNACLCVRFDAYQVIDNTISRTLYISPYSMCQLHALPEGRGELAAG
jgi:hypothetical protein